MQQKLHHGPGVEARGHIVEHDAGSFGQTFQLAHRRRLDDVKPSEKYKGRQQRFPRHRDSDQSNQLSRDFVNDHKLRIFDSGCARHLSSSGNTDGNHNRRQ